MPATKNHPSLPFQLLKEIGAQDPKRRHGTAPLKKSLPGRDHRRAGFAPKKSRHTKVSRTHTTPNHTRPGSTNDTPKNPRPQNSSHFTSNTRPETNKLKRGPVLKCDDNRDEAEKEGGDSEEMGCDQNTEHSADDELYSLGDQDESSGRESQDVDSSRPQSRISRSVQDRLEQDDAEIAALERKLGISGRKSVPKSFMEDGLGDILLGLEHDLEDTQRKKKRKSEADDWLAGKRRKAERIEASATASAKIDQTHDGCNITPEPPGRLQGNPDFLGQGSDEGSFDGFSSGDEAAKSLPETRIKENPYLPPAASASQLPSKYVPPSRRREAGLEDESTARLNRRIRGLTNRISDQNLVPFTIDVETIYRENPRQHVSRALIDQLLGLVCNDTAVTEKNFLLLAAFTTAVYRVVGIDFGAHLIQVLVERFQLSYEEARLSPANRLGARRAANLLSFLSGLYNFQLIGSNLLFDYIRLLLSDLSELAAELLLRITRLSGHLLRQDDPLALKDIVSLTSSTVAKVGKDNLSVRTLVLIESINDLKNNKRTVDSKNVVIEYISQTKKTLGLLSTRHLKGTEPLRIGLKDIQDSDRQGKWWLIGASWTGKSFGDTEIDTSHRGTDPKTMLTSKNDPDLPDLLELAREQTMNTDVRRSIFVAILSATDCEDAYFRLLKLRLNKDRQKEIPNVVMQCAGAEQQYNPYYTLLAKRLCSDRKMRWSFQDNLWRLFRRLGESIFGDDVDDEDDGEAVEMRRLVNIAKMMGTLISQCVLSLNILKSLNLPYLQPKTQAFVEVMLITVFIECHIHTGEDEYRAAVFKIFAAVAESPELARGLRWFLKKVIRVSDLTGDKDKTRVVRAGCSTAMSALDKFLASAGSG